MMRTANPTLRAETFSGFAYTSVDGAMTIQGTVNKTAVLLALAVLTAAWSWSRWDPANPSAVMPLVWGGALGGFIVAMVTVFKRPWSPITAPLYALLEGLFLGAISAMMEMQFSGIVFQAVCLTFGTLLGLLMAYKSGLIRATENFKLGIVAATGGIALVYIVSMVLGFFGMNIPLIHESGPVGIGFSLVVVVIAALNLVLDFDFIETGAEHRAPKYMEWYGAFGLMVTLVWLYIEILRLLAKMRSRD